MDSLFFLAGFDSLCTWIPQKDQSRFRDGGKKVITKGRRAGIAIGTFGLFVRPTKVDSTAFQRRASALRWESSGWSCQPQNLDYSGKRNWEETLAFDGGDPCIRPWPLYSNEEISIYKAVHKKCQNDTGGGKFTCIANTQPNFLSKESHSTCASIDFTKRQGSVDMPRSDLDPSTCSQASSLFFICCVVRRFEGFAIRLTQADTKHVKISLNPPVPHVIRPVLLQPESRSH